MSRTLISGDEHASLRAWRSGDRVYVDARNIELTPDQARAFGSQVSALADLAGAHTAAPMTHAEQLVDAMELRR